MRKITHLFLLCALIMLSAVTAKAQTAAEIQTSTAPSNGEFAEDTHWFTILLRGTYLSVENVDDNGYFLSGSNGFNTINNNIDKGLWCVVGDDTNGYKLYNKSEGATKVLAINYVSTNTGGGARSKMVDASTENATTTGADNWLTTFDIHKNTTSNVGAYSISVKGLTNYYFNQRSPYLAFWISDRAQEEIGSSFYFYNLSSYVSAAESFADAYTDNTGGVFQPSAEELANFKNSISAATWDDVKTINSTLLPNFKAAIDAHKPIVGKRYLIKNRYNQKMIVPNVIPGSVLNVQTGDITKDAIWTLESGDTEDTYKLKNSWSGLYINGVKANTTGSDFRIITSDVYNNTAAIGTGTDTQYAQNLWLHGNQDPIILWTANAGASRWTFEEVSDDDFNGYAPLPSSFISTLVNSAWDFLGVASTEKAALQSNPTYENYQSYYNKVKEGTDNQYVRFQCAKSGNTCFMGLNDDYTVVRALEASTKETNLSNIWKLVPIEGETGYKLMNANTGTYLSNIPNATSGANNSAPTLTDFATGYKFTFSLKNETNGNWNVIDGNGNKLNAETNGCINYWTSDLNAGWWILKATDIQVALNSLGDASYASLYLPFSISAVSGADAYVANKAASNNTLVMQTTEDGGFAANQGVVLVGASGTTTATLTLGENSNTSHLRGTNSPVTLTDDTRADYLVFGPKDGATNTVGFWTPASSLTIPANRAYYQSADGQAVALKFNGSIIEGINEIVNAENAAAPIYDLTGRRVNNTLKGGIYIQNGKKFIVK